MNESLFYRQFSRMFTIRNLIVVTLILAALLLHFLFSWVSLDNLPATSDEAAAVLQAKMIARGDFPLLFIGQPYQFPIESYLMAPVVKWVPRNSFGARYQMLILGLLSMAGFLLIIRNAFPQGGRWPAAVLVLFPSAYFLMLTSAYAPPQYSISLTLCWLGIYLVLKIRQSQDSYILPVLTGLISGLAFSNHLLTVTVSAGVFALILFGGSARHALYGVILFTLGFLIGAVPYLLAIICVPGAYENLPNPVNIFQTLHRLIDLVFIKTFPGAMGFSPPLFPDFATHLEEAGWLQIFFAGGYLIMTGLLLIQRVDNFVRQGAARHWPLLKLVDLGLVTTFLSFILFAYHNVGVGQYRYLLPAVWCFPFLVGYAYISLDNIGRWFVGILTVCLVFINISTSIAMINEWQKPGLIEKVSDTPRLGGLLKVLDEQDIQHCYASFWLAYRITFATDEKIICSLPFNERFPNWPIPYKHEVDASPDAVYVLTQTFSARLTALNFLRHLRENGVTKNRVKVGPFLIYSGFDYPAAPDVSILAPGRFVLHSSKSAEDLEGLKDGDLTTTWSYPEVQQNGQWLQLDFSASQTVSSLTIFHLPGKSGSAESIRVLGLEKNKANEGWQIIANNVHSSFQHFRFVNRHPVYGGLPQTIRFEPVQLTSMRIKIVKPKTHVHWRLAEIEVGILVDKSKVETNGPSL